MLPVGTYALPIGNKYHDSQFLVICFFGNAALGLREFTPCGDRYGAPSTKKRIWRSGNDAATGKVRQTEIQAVY